LLILLKAGAVSAAPALNFVSGAGLPTMRFLVTLVQDRGGASAAEYALVLGIVGAAIAVAALTLGDTISDSMNFSSSQIANCGGGC
jgi:pilus assembly protein Flp/PilA